MPRFIDSIQRGLGQGLLPGDSPTFTGLTISGLTATRVVFAGTAGLLSDDADMTFATDTLTVTKLIGSTQITSPTIYGSAAASGTLTLASTSHGTLGNISIGRLTLSDLANSTGIVFGSLGTATYGIDLSSSGLSGNADYWLYMSASNYWRADGYLYAAAGLSSLALYNIVGEAIVSIGADTRIFGRGASANVILRVDVTPRAVLIGTEDTVGSLTACTSNGTTTITKTNHGLSLAAGDLVHVTGATTGADKGFYTLMSFGASTLVVDRALSGSDANVALTVYKDMIGFFPSDGVYGQRIMNYSHQNKPLQLGGHVLAATTNLASKDIYIGGDIGFSGETANGTVATVMGNLGPTGAQTTIQGWIKTIDSGGVARYTPYW